MVPQDAYQIHESGVCESTNINIVSKELLAGFVRPKIDSSEVHYSQYNRRT